MPAWTTKSLKYGFSPREVHRCSGANRGNIMPPIPFAMVGWTTRAVANSAAIMRTSAPKRSIFTTIGVSGLSSVSHRADAGRIQLWVLATFVFRPGTFAAGVAWL
jgi:hypothetical protein